VGIAIWDGALNDGKAAEIQQNFPIALIAAFAKHGSHHSM
jgi:hypothetical protein